MVKCVCVEVLVVFEDDVYVDFVVELVFLVVGVVVVNLFVDVMLGGVGVGVWVDYVDLK